MPQTKGQDSTYTFKRVSESNFQGHGIQVRIRPNQGNFSLDTPKSTFPIQFGSSPRVFTFTAKDGRGCLGLLTDGQLLVSVNPMSEYHMGLGTSNVPQPATKGTPHL